MHGFWPILLSTGFLSASGVAALIGLIQKGRQDRTVNNATMVAEVVDGLKTIAQERSEDLKTERELCRLKDQRIAELEAQLASRPPRRPSK